MRGGFPTLTFVTTGLVNGDTVAWALPGSLTTSARRRRRRQLPHHPGLADRRQLHASPSAPLVCIINPAPLNVTANKPCRWSMEATVPGFDLWSRERSLGQLGDTEGAALSGALDDDGLISLQRWQLQYLPGDAGVQQ